MPTRVRRLASLLLTLTASLALASACGPPSGAAEEPEAPRATMHEILDAVAFLLPLSLSDERFRDPAHREAILGRLALLAEEADALARHGRARDAGFAFLSAALARDARAIHERFAAGRVEEARFGIHETVDTCVACHSRLPDGARPLGRELMQEESVAALPLDERAKLLMATRQWDRALAAYETLFRSEAIDPGVLDLMGYLDDYLEMALRVERDPDRARRTLRAMAERDDLGPPLRANAQHWIASLAELAGREPAASPLAEARRLVALAEDRTRFDDERAALVVYVAASGQLHRFLRDAPRRGPRAAEAYYLLGLVESRIGRAFWLSQTEALLEASIRAAPASPVARDAHVLLVEFVTSGYTGSAGRAVPEEVQRWLDDLERLIEAAREPAEAA